MVMSFTPPVNPPCADLMSQELSPGNHTCHRTVALAAHVAETYDDPSSQVTYALRGIADDVPACSYCGIWGYISRFSKKRQPDLHLYGQRGRLASSPPTRDQSYDTDKRRGYWTMVNDGHRYRDNVDRNYCNSRPPRHRTPLPYPYRSPPCAVSQ